jgi:hypothetical protein
MRSSKQLRPAMFWFDGGVHIRGWTDGDEWNGWGVPLFDDNQLPNAIRALSDVGFRVERVGPARPLLRLKHEDEDRWTDYKPEIHNGKQFWRLDGLTWNYEPTGARFMRESRFSIPGWSVGYNREIGAHAAVRSVPGAKDTIFVMTSDDREPRSLDEEATVGLYVFDGENWEQVAWQDFPDVSSVVKLSDAELQLVIEHALSLDQARDLLIQEFEEWEEGDGEVSMMPWMATILEDAGVVDAAGAAFPEARGAQREAIEQIRNASPKQILDYMNERSEAINE